MAAKSQGIVTSEAAPPKKGPKVLREVRIKRSMDGGHVVTHDYEGYQHDPKSYTFGKNEGTRAAAHIARHAGLPGGGGASEPATAEDAEG